MTLPLKESRVLLVCMVISGSIIGLLIDEADGSRKMKDKIFLIWSGNNTVAQKVKNILETEHSYICVVGGSFESGAQMLTIGDTVLKQMKGCNQAIVIFQNKANNTISNNLYFELGFVASSYGLKKIHCVKRKSETITLPSDFDNSFVKGLEADSDDMFAQNIVKYFMGRQKLSVETNRMWIINNRHIVHEMIQAHYSDMGSKCSDYELAQYILFYMQAAVMFQDDEKVLNELKNFKKRFGNDFSEELNESVNISIALLDIQTSLKSSDDIVYIGDEDFRRYYNSCKDILSDIKDDDSGIYDEWAKAIAAENLAYVCVLYAGNPDLDKTMKEYLSDKTIQYGNICLGFLDKLEEGSRYLENNDHIGIIAVFKAYLYRHLFIAYRDKDKDEAGKWLQLAAKTRRQLVRNFDDNTVDSKIYSNFEMEYYVSLIEYILFFGKDSIDPFDYMVYMKDIDEYIAKIEKTDSIHAFVKQIENQRQKLD